MKQKNKIIVVGIVALIGIMGFYFTVHTVSATSLPHHNYPNTTQVGNSNLSHHNEHCENYESHHQNHNITTSSNVQGIRRLISDMTLTEEDITLAQKYQVSETKILFVKKALQQNPNLKLEDIIYLPTKEIANYISE